jgi:hypothetical protein
VAGGSPAPCVPQLPGVRCLACKGGAEGTAALRPALGT